FSEAKKVVQVAVTDRRGFTGFVELFPRVVPDRFDHGIARVTRLVGLDVDEGFVKELFEEVEHLEVFDSISRTDLFQSFKRASAGEDSHSAEGDPFLLGEKIVAPVDQSLECLLMGKTISPATAQQPETIVEPRRDLLDAQQFDACGCKLDRERDAIESAANLRNRTGICLG